MDAQQTKAQIEEAMTLFANINNQLKDKNPTVAIGLTAVLYLKVGVEKLIRSKNPEAKQERWFVI